MTTTKTQFQSIAPGTSSVAIGGYSPVSYFQSGRPERGKEEFSVKHDGITYHLTSADQVSAFRADPEKYIPSYGGWCSFGMSIQKEFPVDPESFKIVDGRLKLFLRNEDTDARALWDKEPEAEVLSKAARSFEARK